MKKRILIIGRVHGVGYRPFLYGIAEFYNLKGFYAENIYVENEEAIEVLIEDDEESINKFIEVIKVKKPEKAEVKDIKILDYEGPVMKIESYYRYLITTLLSTIATYGRNMFDKMDQMLDKQDKNFGEAEQNAG